MLAITATDLPRLLACNGSRIMGGLNPPMTAADGDDTVRNEGNAADWLVAQVFSGQFTAEELVDRKAPNGVYITPEMVEYLDEYLKAVRQGGHIEIDTSYAGPTWQINGRADHTLYDERTRTLYVDDLKFGWSIVEAEMNWTLISHVFGFMRRFPHLQIEHAVLTIYQPRPHHHIGRVRSWSINTAEIGQLFNQMCAILANLDDKLNTGEHCYRCPFLSICPAARNAQMNAIEASERAFVDNIDNDNLSFQLDHLDRSIEILKQRKKAYDEMALHRLKEGQIIKNYSAETGLSNREWQEHVTPEFVEMLTGKDLSKKKLITPAQAEKAGVNKDVVASMTERHNTGVKLVRIDANAKAKKLFNNPKGN